MLTKKQYEELEDKAHSEFHRLYNLQERGNPKHKKRRIAMELTEQAVIEEILKEINDRLKDCDEKLEVKDIIMIDPTDVDLARASELQLLKQRIKHVGLLESPTPRDSKESQGKQVKPKCMKK